MEHKGAKTSVDQRFRFNPIHHIHPRPCTLGAANSAWFVSKFFENHSVLHGCFKARQFDAAKKQVLAFMAAKLSRALDALFAGPRSLRDWNKYKILYLCCMQYAQYVLGRQPAMQFQLSVF